MRYQTIQDLPFVFQYNLPEPALQVYKDAFNRAWTETTEEREARMRAWAAVQRRFVKDPLTGSWVPR